MSAVSNALTRLNERLREENELLKEQNAYLRSALMGAVELPLEWKLTKTEQRIMSVCLARDLATKEALAAALYWDKEDPADGPSNVKVHISKIRRKLKPFGIEIKTIWGQGFHVPAEIREQFRSRIEQRAAA